MAVVGAGLRTRVKTGFVEGGPTALTGRGRRMHGLDRLGHGDDMGTQDFLRTQRARRFQPPGSFHVDARPQRYARKQQRLPLRGKASAMELSCYSAVKAEVPRVRRTRWRPTKLDKVWRWNFDGSRTLIQTSAGAPRPGGAQGRGWGTRLNNLNVDSQVIDAMAPGGGAAPSIARHMARRIQTAGRSCDVQTVASSAKPHVLSAMSQWMWPASLHVVDEPFFMIECRIDAVFLRPLCNKSMSWMVRFVLIVATAVLTSLSTKSPRNMRQHAMHFKLRGPNLTIMESGSQTGTTTSATDSCSWQAFLRSSRATGSSW